MPVYTYRCHNCGVQFDRRQALDDKQLTRCPECGKEALRKVYLPVGIVFKGSGFYATDHRSPSGQQTTKKTDSTPNNKKDKSEDTPPSSESSQDD
jgi:putative FmdB family regulatory protein